MANKHPKAGPGRPKGALNKRTRALIARMEGGGRVPFHKMTEPEAMLFKMRWWLNRMAAEVSKASPDYTLIEKCLDKAQEAAVAAAPYHHARLSAVTVKPAPAATESVRVVRLTVFESAQPLLPLVPDYAGGSISATEKTGADGGR